jgi:hypothetical protein
MTFRPHKRFWRNALLVLIVALPLYYYTHRIVRGEISND